MIEPIEKIGELIASCRVCNDRFAATATAHRPRPVFWCEPTAKLLVAGQAPGARVHASGVFFDDASGERLRDWMGLDRTTFYDRRRIAILPMAFCFPGYDRNGSDLPPPTVCARLWRNRVIAQLPDVRTTLLIGRHAQLWHLGDRARCGVRELVEGWRDHAPEYFPMPHPSWRNNALVAGLKGFEEELLPALQKRVRELLS
ncbi:MAG: uracil-DNA glycosylase family protein [Rhodobacteraceae bacterium]|nr:uracil-DNA glycosylase family protein [Paracoccaceae bacterium]